MHATFEAVSILDPLSNLAHSLLAFLFSKTFFFEVKFWRLCPEVRSGDASGSAGRHEDKAERTSSQAIWPTQGSGHDRTVTPPRVRGEKTDGDLRLPHPTPSFETCFRKPFSVKADF